jgi:DNA-binding LytR/AlgR family response regulator
MPGISGLELAEKLKGKTVIFVTGHKEYADQAFDLEVLDFVKKPIRETRLAEAIQKINKKFNTNADFAYLPTPTGDLRVKYADIIYVTTSKIDSRDKDLYLISKEKPITIKTKNLDNILNLLNPDLFMIINKHCLVNLNHVLSKSKQRQIELTAPLHGKPIQEEVSEKYWKDFSLRSGIV